MSPAPSSTRHEGGIDVATNLRNFRCDEELWRAFVAACREAGTDASAQIRAMIEDWLNS